MGPVYGTHPIGGGGGGWQGLVHIYTLYIYIYIHYIYIYIIYIQYIPHYTTIIYTITLCIIPACDPNQAPLAPVAEAPSGSGFIAPWSKRLSERKKGA